MLTKTRAAAKESRTKELTNILEGRRRELMHEVHGKIRDARADSTREREVRDQGESSEIDIQDEIELALLEMKAETLKKVDAALRRLGEGAYGDCFECGNEIPRARLRALPFAVRCKDCEEIRETIERRERLVAQRHGSRAVFVDMAN
jgi:DnaK suppressor protein